MASDNPQLDELRRITGPLMVKMYTAMAVLDRTIEVAPNIDCLKACTARQHARLAMREFSRWLLIGAVGDEVRVLEKALDAATREDAEMR